MQTGNRKCPRHSCCVGHVPRKLSALRSIFNRRGACIIIRRGASSYAGIFLVENIY